MKNLLLLLTLVISINLLSQTQKEIDSYYEEICLNTEFDGKLSEPAKFKENVYIYFESSKEDSIYFYDEFLTIVAELNDLIETIEVIPTTNKIFSDVEVYLGDSEGWLSTIEFIQSDEQIERKRKLLEKNYGFFFTRGSKTEIRMAYAFINTKVFTGSKGGKNTPAIKHLMWEEITQSFGLYNDSFTYPESIFYQGWTKSTLGYCDIDKEIIKKLYNN